MDEFILFGNDVYKHSEVAINTILSVLSLCVLCICDQCVSLPPEDDVDHLAEEEAMIPLALLLCAEME